MSRIAGLCKISLDIIYYAFRIKKDFLLTASLKTSHVLLKTYKEDSEKMVKEMEQFVNLSECSFKKNKAMRIIRQKLMGIFKNIRCQSSPIKSKYMQQQHYISFLTICPSKKFFFLIVIVSDQMHCEVQTACFFNWFLTTNENRSIWRSHK